MSLLRSLPIPDDYGEVIAAIEENGGSTTQEQRARLAAKAFARTAAYDSAITTWLSGELGGDLPNGFAAGGVRSQMLRYGENPHQRAALYIGGPSPARRRHGGENSRQGTESTTI